jgi:hypothetical protein
VIAYLLGDELYAINTAGGPAHFLMDRNFLAGLTPTSGEEVRIGHFDFGYDLEHYVFVNTFVVNGLGNEDLFRVDADTQVPVRVFPPGQGGVFHISPDSQWIAFSRPNELALGHSDGTDARELVVFPPGSGFGTHEEGWSSQMTDYVLA